MAEELRARELFDEQGRLKRELAELAPKGERRMGANPHAGGGRLLRDLRMPDFREYAVVVPAPGVLGISDTHVPGRFPRGAEHNALIELRNQHRINDEDTPRRATRCGPRRSAPRGDGKLRTH